MTKTDEIKHTADLPFGYRATFRWSPATSVAVEWEPSMPGVIKSSRARRKFREVYNAARRAFYRDVATCIGAAVLSVDIDGALESVLPAPKH